MNLSKEDMQDILQALAWHKVDLCQSCTYVGIEKTPEMIDTISRLENLQYEFERILKK